jgi:hypothetical protein
MKLSIATLKSIWSRREVIKAYLKELALAWPIAKAKVLAGADSKYTGTVRMQIAYNETRTELIRSGMLNDDITGAVIYIALGMAYLFLKHKQQS